MNGAGFPKVELIKIMKTIFTHIFYQYYAQLEFYSLVKYIFDMYFI